MSISGIQSSGAYQVPEAQRTQAAPPVPAQEQGASKRDRLVPEDRAFDRYEPEDKAETTTANTDRVDRELAGSRKRQEELEQQLRSAAPEQAQAIQRQLDQVEQELAQKDNDAYRRQHAVFS